MKKVKFATNYKVVLAIEEQANERDTSATNYVSSICDEHLPAVRADRGWSKEFPITLFLQTGQDFSINHLVIYSPRVIRDETFTIRGRGKNSILSSLDDDSDRGREDANTLDSSLKLYSDTTGYPLENKKRAFSLLSSKQGVGSILNSRGQRTYISLGSDAVAKDVADDQARLESFQSRD
ncbi:hypothetical protein HAX54_020192 [Datura stramonium]|uniref:Uncharacterized protein n=1 Tax=Datura stramonium TaxID=4076 RepID=A0ABS8USW7_DATST|nr:hypothetical protein [Datura stramonium]